ncbi:MAG: hypothetical protein FLDDKLPJ_00304 [Phycisphaerae bacterium]|nr:hypothetical protein [Phycisphaerae bacterium]
MGYGSSETSTEAPRHDRSDAAGLVAVVVRRTARHVAATAHESRRAIAQVFTPAPVARFMAARVARIGEEFHFIDAGAGVGVLAAALCERIAGLAKPRQVTAELYETDPAVIPLLRETMRECRKVLTDAGHDLTVSYHDEDFVLRRPAASLYAPEPRTAYADVVLMNPPYAKLAKDSPQARAFAEIVHGQPNVYALFMAAAICRLSFPSAASRTIFARAACRAGTVRLRDQAVSVRRSSWVNVISTARRMGSVLLQKMKPAKRR